MKYRKKPVVIEAIQLRNGDGAGNTIKECEDFIGDNGKFDTFVNSMALYTLKGVLWVRDGDYIIKDINGEFYPCKPDVFEETYERVEEV